MPKSKASTRVPSCILAGLPWTPETQAALKTLKRAVRGSGQVIRAKGRGPRKATAEADGKRADAYWQTLPLRHATYVDLYRESRPSDRDPRALHLSRDLAAVLETALILYQCDLEQELSKEVTYRNGREPAVSLELMRVRMLLANARYAQSPHCPD